MTALFPSSAWSHPDSTTLRSSTSRMIKAPITWRLGWVFFFYFFTDMHLGHHLINSIYLYSDTALKDAVCCSLLTWTIWLGVKSLWEDAHSFFIHLCWSDHGKHDNRSTLNPLTPLSSLSPSVSISHSCFFPLFLCSFSQYFLCNSIFLSHFHSPSQFLLLRKCVFPTSGKDQRWVVLNFEVSAARVWREWEERQSKETSAEYM